MLPSLPFRPPLHVILTAVALWSTVTLVAEPVAAQGSGTITGTVTERDTGRPLVAASVQIVGGRISTLVDATGRFQLQGVPAGPVEIRAQLLGYAASSQTVNVPSGGAATIDFVLDVAALALEGIVVTAFGIERQVRSMTTTTQSVNTSTLTEARQLNVVNSLQGKVAGLNINTTEGPGTDARVVLRGNRSINGSSQPLFVLDGTPTRGGIGDINPDEIATIHVLKGANAAALYGSAAQNGAIVITTHRAVPGAMRFSVNQTVTVDAPMWDDIWQNEYGQGSGGVYSPTSEFSWGPRMEGQTVDYWRLVDSDLMDGRSYAFLPQPNNVKDGFRNGFNTTTNLTGSMGDQATQATFSYAYTDAQGMTGDEFDRHNVSVRVYSDILDRLSLDTRLTFVRRSSTGGTQLQALYRLPRNIRTEDMEVFEYVNRNGLTRQNYFNPGTNSGRNPYWTRYRQLSGGWEQRFLGMASATYTITDGLTLMARASYDGDQNHSESRAYVDTYSSAPNGNYTLTKNDGMQVTGDLLLSHEYVLGGNWSINSNLGSNVQKNRNSSISSNTGQTGLVVPNLFTLSNTQTIVSSHSIGSPTDVYSVFGSTQLGWRNALFLDLTARNDWSSTLPPENNSYLYPSAGMSAVLSDLIAVPEIVSYLQLRTSWARVGNAAPAFQLYRTAEVMAGGYNGLLSMSSTLPNTQLMPEQTESIEIGGDVRILDNRLGLDATWYKMNTANQLFTVALPVGSGAQQFYTNGGDVENKGFELVLSAALVRAGRVNWDLDMTFARNRNTVVAISDERPRLIVSSGFLRDYVIEQGQPYGQMYGRDFLRDDQGRVMVGRNGMPLLTPGKTVLLGDYNPDWTGGISSNFSYNNLNFTFVIDHRQGGILLSNRNAVLSSDGVLKSSLQGREGGLVFGDNFFSHETAILPDGSPNNVPINSETFWKGIGGNNAPVSSVFVESATNTRIREMTLGYDVPLSILRHLPVSNLRLSLSGRNLLFLYRESDNIDADMLSGTGTSAEGQQGYALPTTRTLGLNVQVDF